MTLRKQRYSLIDKEQISEQTSNNMAKKLNNTQKKKEADSLKAQALEAAKNDEFLGASFFAAQALKLYGEAGNKTGVAELKKLVIEYNKKAEANMQEHEFSIELDEKTRNEIQELIKSLTKADKLTDNLERISKSQAVIPNFATAQKNAKEIVPVTAQLVTHMGIGADGHLASFDDFENDWLRDHYGFQMDFSIKLLNSVFSELITKGQLNEKNIMDTVIAKGIFHAEYLLKLQIALERRFADDYFSAVHILVPLVENTFISLSKLVGLDTFTYNGKSISTRNSNFSLDMLKSKEYQDMWGEYFCYMLSFFLLEPNAYRFRHKVAHGEITVSECNYTSFNILLFFIIKMILMIKIEPKAAQS